jgi:hypothetical protein
MNAKQKRLIYTLWGVGVICTFLVAIVAGGNLNPLQRMHGWEITAPSPAAPEASQNLTQRQNEALSDEYVRARAAFLERVRNISFAAGCDVLGTDSDAKAVLAQGQVSLHRQALTQGIASDPRLTALIQSAEHAGQGQAAQGCDYWRDNPEAALIMRRETQITDAPP